MMNKQHELNETMFMTMKKDDFKKKFVSTNINEKSLNSHVKENEKFYVFLKILDKFEKF